MVFKSFRFVPNEPFNVFNFPLFKQHKKLIYTSSGCPRQRDVKHLIKQVFITIIRF